MQCSYCGDRYTDDQYSSEHKATGHKWIVNTDPADPASDEDKKNGWVTVKEADCLNAAQLERKCSVCDFSEPKEAGKPLGHMLNDKTVEKVPCKVDLSLIDKDGNTGFAFECERENCPVTVTIDNAGNTRHYITASAHKMKVVEEKTFCVAEDSDEDLPTGTNGSGKGYRYEICENCDTYGTTADATKNKVTELEPTGHKWNTVQVDGKTSVVVCIEDKGLNTQDKYLEYMRSVVDFATFQANWQKYVAAWNNAYEITSKPNIPTQGENGNPVLVVFDLNGNTLTMDLESADEPSKCVWLVQNELVFQNGNVVVESNDKGAFDVDAGASLTMDNVVLRTDNNAIRTDPTSTAGAEINLTKTTIYSEGNFGVATNANNVNYATTKDVVINIVDSYIYMNPNAQNEAGKGNITDNTALFINVPSKVTVDGSTLVANRQVVMVRGGTLQMSDSKLILEAATIDGDSLTMDWADGNTAPRAAMLLGNKNRASQTSGETAYQYKTTVILDNVTFDVEAGDRTVVIASDYEESTILKQEDTKFPAGTADENKTFDNISTMPIMVYLDAGNCVTDKQIDFVPGYIPGTIQLIDCGNASGIY